MKIPGITDEMLALYKQQWAAAGLDPEAMMAQLRQSLELAAAVQEQAMAIHQQAGIGGADIRAASQDPDYGFALDDAPQIHPEPDVSAAEHFKALACGSNLAYLDCMYLNTLSSGKPSGQIIAMLYRDWGIEDFRGLRSTIEWLVNSGHRRFYECLVPQIKGIRPADFARHVQAAATKLGEDFGQIEDFAVNSVVTQQWLKARGAFVAARGPSMLAWDLGRAINLCRWGFDAGYLERDEALKIILACASTLYGHYDSWRDLSEGYLLGFGCWSGDEGALAELWDDHELLLTHTASPWVSISWA